MKRRFAWWLSLAFLAATPTGCSVGEVGAPQVPPGPYQVVHVTASDWKWTLSQQRLKYGKTVEFLVKSIQGVHGFAIIGSNVSTPVTAGEPARVVYWNPPAKGVYTIACNVYCGAGHRSMVTTFAVD